MKKNNKKTYGAKGDINLDHTFYKAIGIGVNQAIRELMKEVQNLQGTEAYDVNILVNHIQQKKLTNEIENITSEMESTLKKFNNLNQYKKELMNELNKKKEEEEYSRRYPELPEYIYKTPDGRYMVRKNWKAGPQVYGRYNTLKKAISKRDYLIEHNWNVKIQRVIMEENGEWYVRQNTMINKKPYKKFYFKSESKEEVEQKYLQYKTEGLPQPFFITDKYRYIIHNRRMYYVRKHEIKYGYARTLKDAIILRTILENTGWKKPANGSIYIYEGTMYKIKYNNHGTPVFEKEIDAQYIRENNDDK